MEHRAPWLQAHDGQGAGDLGRHGVVVPQPHLGHPANGAQQKSPDVAVRVLGVSVVTLTFVGVWCVLGVFSL